MNNIILLGFRYSGKSTIAKTISEIIRWKLIDLDTEIEKHTNDTIFNLVQTNDGWNKFRQIELKLFQKFLNQSNVVISCGGGLAVNELFGEKEKLLLNQSQNSLKILLEINDECLIDRIKKDYHVRPLLSNKKNNNLHNIIEENLELYTKRKPLYELINYDCKIDSSYNNITNAMKNKTLCCIIGYPVWHSLSPKIHNACYKNLKINDKFVYTKIEIPPQNLSKIKDIINIFNIKGVSVTSPYKEKILQYVDNIDDLSDKIGAINTIVNQNNQLFGYNTDSIGIKMALKNKCELKNKKIAIFGSGGAAKSAVIALLIDTKFITIFNRTKEKNDIFAKTNNIKSSSLYDFNANNFDIIINATTVGLNSNESILKENQILKKHIVFDMICNPFNTTFLQIAKYKKANIIHGIDSLLYQAMEQFELYTNLKANLKIAKNAILINDHQVCIVVIGKTIIEFIKNLKKAQTLSSFVELRTDYIENLSLKNIDKIAKILKVDAIFTCRMIKDGGNFDNTLEENKKIIIHAISLNKFTYFNIDLSNAEEYKDIHLKRNNWQLILSYHDFKNSINYEEYIQILNQMNEFNPDIKKIAITIDTSEDITNMKNVLMQYTNANNRIIFSPITDNIIIGLLAFKLNSWTNFFCLNAKNQTSNGQICVKDFYHYNH